MTLNIRLFSLLLIVMLSPNDGFTQDIIPIDTTNWEIKARSYVLENFNGKDAIYLKGGTITLKDDKFKNGTIEFDLFLKEEQAFPGVVFRIVDNDAEQFFLRTHLSGKPDANQASPVIQGITPWQLYFGPKYSFPYNYNYVDWTHIRLVVNEGKAQVYLDYSEKPNLSWDLFHFPREGNIMFKAGRRSGIHIADVKINKEEKELTNFNPIERTHIDGIINEWEISDMFEKKLLEDHSNLSPVIAARTWGKKIEVEEGTAANISRVQLLFNGEPGETVFAKINIHSNKNQIKLFHFGYSDEVVAILNGKAMYKGTNKWRSRDYRYLGTIGLFDAIYLNLKKGNNTLLMAVSESFGGWLITGKFEDNNGIKIK
jgi:hypothetical protein